MKKLKVRHDSGKAGSTFQDLDMGKDFLNQTPVTRKWGRLSPNETYTPDKIKNLFRKGNG